VTFASALTSSSGALTLSDTAGGGTLTLSAANTYGGGTTVNAGTLNVTGSIPGNVTVNGGVLELGNPSALSSSATVSLGAGVPVQLNYSGTQNISALYINGFQAPAGVYGASPAYNPGGIFSGLGTFTVGNGPASVTISSETIVNNQLVISWNSAAGENYNVYSTTNLSLPLSSWTLVNSSGPITAASGSTSYTLPGNVSSQPALFITVQQ